MARSLATYTRTPSYWRRNEYQQHEENHPKSIKESEEEMNPGEEIDNQLDVLETKIELLMAHLGLEFEFLDAWSDAPTGQSTNGSSRPKRKPGATLLAKI